MSDSLASGAAAPDLATLMAITIAAGALATVLHEGLGHGGACVLSGGHVLVVSTVHEECSVGNAWIDAGGTMVNLGAGMLAWWGLRQVRRANGWRYFLWLLMTINLLQVGGYWLFSGLGNIGDWAMVLAGHRPAWLWHGVLTVAGAVLYFACVRWSMRELKPWLDHGDSHRWRRARRLCLVPYFTYGVMSCVAGALNPVGPLLIAISAAAASFGGASGLAWGWEFTRNAWYGRPGPELPPLARSWGWIVAGAVIASLFVGVLGRGVFIA